MEKEQKIIYTNKARKAFEELALYIEQKGYPDTSEKYIQRMLDFGESLLIFPDKYSVCRFPNFAKRNLHCAVFENTYIFVYKIEQSRLIVYNILNSKRVK